MKGIHVQIGGTVQNSLSQAGHTIVGWGKDIGQKVESVGKFVGARVKQAYDTGANLVNSIGKSAQNLSASLPSIAWGLGLAAIGSVAAYEIFSNSGKRTYSGSHYGSLDNCRMCKKMRSP